MTRVDAIASARPTDEPPLSVRDRAVLALLSTVGGIALRLPEPLLQRVAHLVGLAYHALARRRRALVRANLARVVGWLTDAGMASPAVAAAAADGRRLDALVRSAFGHYVRYYLELLLSPRYAREDVGERLEIVDPAVAERMLGERGGLIVVGLHLGAIEMPGTYLVRRAGRRVTAPMETLTDPAVQAWIERTRATTGVMIIPIRGSGRRLIAALAAGEVAGVVGDRDLQGHGVAVDLFGHATTVPGGVALLAHETTAPIFAAAAWRVGWGRYAARAIEIERPAPGPLRAWVSEFAARQAHAYERLISVAPEQWWSIFFPIWPDLDGRRT